MRKAHVETRGQRNSTRLTRDDAAIDVVIGWIGQQAHVVTHCSRGDQCNVTRVPLEDQDHVAPQETGHQAQLAQGLRPVTAAEGEK